MKPHFSTVTKLDNKVPFYRATLKQIFFQKKTKQKMENNDLDAQAALNLENFNHIEQLEFAKFPPPNFSRRLESGVSNGDCLPACIVAALEVLRGGEIVSREFHDSASQLRQQLNSWIEANWLKSCLFSDCFEVGEIIEIGHSLTLQQWLDERQQIYWSDVECLIFSCFFHEKVGLSIVFRIWRNGLLSTTVPDIDYQRTKGVIRGICIDLLHVGEIESNFAHYKLLDGGSLAGRIRVRQQRKRRRRLIKASELNL